MGEWRQSQSLTTTYYIQLYTLTSFNVVRFHSWDWEKRKSTTVVVRSAVALLRRGYQHRRGTACFFSIAASLSFSLQGHLSSEKQKGRKKLRKKAEHLHRRALLLCTTEKPCYCLLAPRCAVYSVCRWKTEWTQPKKKTQLFFCFFCNLLFQESLFCCARLCKRQEKKRKKRKQLQAKPFS